MSSRVVIVTTLLVSALLVQSITETYFTELNPLYFLVGLTYLLTLVYSVLYALGRWGRGFLFVQLLGDLLIITGLIALSGGIDSAFPFLYILTIITAAILLPRRGSLLIALLACILYGALAALLYNDVLPAARGFLASPATLTMNQVYYNLFVRWIGFLAAALLSSYLAEKLRETGETLEERAADLEKLQVFYDDIINSVNSGLLSTDVSGSIRSLNHAGERILELPFATVRGRSFQRLLDLPERRLLGEGAQEGRFEVRFRTAGGGIKELGLAVSRLFDRHNLHRGYTVVFQDLTTLKQLEREVRLKERMAALGEMAAAMAHEIRNPLASMSGSIQMLRSDLELEGEQMALMDIVLAESDRLNRTIEEFLFYARPAPPLPRPVELAALVEGTLALVRNSPEVSRRHVLDWTVAGDELTLQADPGQVRQVLLNLVRNGLQAMPDGGRLNVQAGPASATEVALVVEDEGPGFPEQDAERLWEPFHSSSTHGSGLGLAIVYRIVRDHGGRVSLENRAPRGARVTVWLPRAAAESTAGAGRPPVEVREAR